MKRMHDHNNVPHTEVNVDLRSSPSPYGSACTSIHWGSNRFISEIELAPGTLTINHRDVERICWTAYSESDSLNAPEMQAMVEKLLSGPHQLTTQQFLRRVKKLHLGYVSELSIYTDSGCCFLYHDANQTSSVYRDGDAECFILKQQHSTEDLVEIGLKLATCANVKRTVTGLRKQWRICCFER